MRMSEFDAPMIEVAWKAGAVRHEWMVVDTGDAGAVTIYRRPPPAPAAVTAPVNRTSFLGGGEERVLPIEWVLIGPCRRYGILGATVERRDDAPVSGCVGLRLLHTWGAVEVDLRENTVTLYSASDPPPPVPQDRGVRAALRHPGLDSGGMGVCVDGTIQTTPCMVIIDTGFNGFVAASESMLRSLGYDTTVAQPVPALTPFASYGARAVSIDRTLHIGGQGVRLAGTAMAFDGSADVVVPENAIILGMRFLRRYNSVRIDWIRQELDLVK
jgi:hypothetical protein